jgi:2,4-dichlorophenol 6-monooxygenase
MTNVETPVLIVGGGGAGLTASMLLSRLGVESLLASALPSTSILPKAHVLNQRAMEILREAGVAERIYAKSTPAEQMQATAWYAGLAGSHPECGRRIARMEAWGAGGRDPRSAWLRQREITAEGAVLVRPDRFVAWRSPGAAPDPYAELGRALARVLGR